MLPDPRSVNSTVYRETLITVNGYRYYLLLPNLFIYLYTYSLHVYTFITGVARLQNFEGYVTSETKRSRNTSLNREICYVLNNLALHIVDTELLKLWKDARTRWTRSDNALTRVRTLIMGLLFLISYAKKATRKNTALRKDREHALKFISWAGWVRSTKLLF